jgi:DNA polymerase-3 subunit delta
VELLAQMVGGNLWVMSGEIAKLALYASERCIGEEDVKTVVGYSQQANIFNMVDAVMESRVGAAQRAIQQLLQAGVAPFYLLYMLARQARLLVQVKDLARQGVPQYEIQTRLGLTADFVWRKTSEQAGRYSLAQLKRLYHCLLEADLSIKTGKYEPELALSILAAELCR